jgi:2-polyprenyl-3-methyl-5-hydroxy-6-metoxy-1,4-benzoquinol methylase
MDKQYERLYHHLESSHWWFKSRRHLIMQLINSLDLSYKAKILDIGCSSGPLIKSLNQQGYQQVYGIDFSKNAISLCVKKRLKQVAVMDAASPAIKADQFDLIIASDILEHLQNDMAALKQWRRILKPNGVMIVIVPAFNFLWSSHDEVNHHFRRYTKHRLNQALNQNRLHLLRSSYSSFSSFLPAALLRLFQRKTHKKSSSFQLNDRLSIFNPLLTTIVKLENYGLNYINFPFGVSVFAIAKKE